MLTSDKHSNFLGQFLSYKEMLTNDKHSNLLGQFLGYKENGVL